MSSSFLQDGGLLFVDTFYAYQLTSAEIEIDQIGTDPAVHIRRSEVVSILRYDLELFVPPNVKGEGDGL